MQGTKEDRVGGDEHMAVVEEFCYAVKDKWPHALIQFEDFQTDRAFAILEKLQDKVLCFNDDIQVCSSYFPSWVVYSLSKSIAAMVGN